MENNGITRAFEHAQCLDGHDRETYLKALEDIDPDIHLEVVSLLSGLEKNASLVEESQQPVVYPSIPGYTIYKEIGRGGMSVVYAARQKSLDRPVAIKMLLDPKHEGRFRDEASFLAKVHHSNILTIHDYGECDGQQWMTTQLIEPGHSLQTHVDRCAKENRPTDISLITRTIKQLCFALEHVHLRHRIVHRDIKPSNVLLQFDSRDDTEAYLIDFGISTSNAPYTRRHTDTGKHFGTVAFASPEQIRGELLSARSDIYSLGVTHYYAICGKLPQWPPEDPSKYHNEASSKMLPYFHKMLHPTPDKRYYSVLNVLNALTKEIPYDPVLHAHEYDPRTPDFINLLKHYGVSRFK